MITFERDGSKVVANVDSGLAHENVENTTALMCQYDAGHAFTADAVVRYLQVQLEEKLREIRREAYARGWRDKAARSCAKETWFSGRW